MNTIPSPGDSPKLCECGCGLPAPIAQRSNSTYGHVKGQPVRFVTGHYQRTIDTTERFWAKVDKSGECWLWIGRKGRRGYGTTSWKGHTHNAHRVAYEITKGPIPPGMLVCHNCPGGDNPSCCNPAHLFLGTHQANMDDMLNKGRAASGERQGQAKLTWPIVREIRAALADGTATKTELARLHDVNFATIDHIQRNLVWRE